MFCNQCGAQIQDGAKFCGSCGTVAGQGGEAPSQSASNFSPVTAHALPAGTAAPNDAAQRTGSRYRSYDQVPFYRKQWFFWLMYITISPIAIGILLFGDVYYPSKGHVKSFGLANRIVAGIIAVAILWRVLSAVA